MIKHAVYPTEAPQAVVKCFGFYMPLVLYFLLQVLGGRMMISSTLGFLYAVAWPE